LTTDFFPNKQTWHEKFIQNSDYTLIMDEIREQYGYKKYSYPTTNGMEKVFYELVGHRLAMGFQMVVPKDTFTYNLNTNTTLNNSNNNNSNTTITTNGTTNVNTTSTITNTNTPTSSSSNTTNNNSNKETSVNNQNKNFICDLSASTSVTARTQFNSIKGYYKLSFGRMYHELFYIGDKNKNSKSNDSDQIKVEIYMPKKRETKDDKENLYTYRFQVPDSKTYDISYVKMTRKNAESIKWNLIDSYICIQGNGNFS
jgi:hypothetical protein